MTGHVLGATLKFEAHRRPEHAKRRTRRRVPSVCPGVHWCDFKTLAPDRVIKSRVLPSPRVHLCIKGLQRQAGNISWNGNCSPSLSWGTSPTTVAQHPVLANECFEDQGSCTKRIGGRHRNPPRSGVSKVACGNGNYIGAFSQMRCQVYEVVVCCSWLRTNGAAGYLCAVDYQNVATVNPDPGRRCGWNLIKVELGTKQHHGIFGIGQHWSSRCFHF